MAAASAYTVSPAATVVVGQFPHPDDHDEVREGFAEELAMAFYECRPPLVAFTDPHIAAMARHFQSPPGAQRIVCEIKDAYSIRSQHRQFGSWDFWAQHATHDGGLHLPAQPESHVLAVWNGKSHFAGQVARSNPFRSSCVWYYDAGAFERYPGTTHLGLLGARFRELTGHFEAPDAIIIFSVAIFVGDE